MKPYILNYSEKVNLKESTDWKSCDSTKITETIETVDEECLMRDSTFITNRIEPSDDDDIQSLLQCSTVVTKTLESTDEEILHLSTIESRTLEPADEDLQIEF